MSMQYEYTGYVHQVGQTQTYPSGFAIRELVLVEDPSAKYLNHAVFQFIKGMATDMTLKLNGIHAGDKVTVKFYLNGNENRNRPGQWFCSLRATSLERIGTAATEIPLASSNVPCHAAPAPAEPSESVSADEIDDMPF